MTTAEAEVIIEMVPVGHPGNAPDDEVMTTDGTTGYGSVDYSYWIGKYEVTNAQWREFLTAMASPDDPYGLYHTEMAGPRGGIDRTGAGTPGDPYVYSAKGGDANWDNRPVNFVSFWDAARFCNWLHNGQGGGDTESGAYVNIGDQSTFARQEGGKFFIPTEDEWYKAAYHKNDGPTGNYFGYPTASDVLPSNDLIDPDPGNNANFHQGGYTIGGPYYMTAVGEFENSESPYGTFDQGGNVSEWNETVVNIALRGHRGVWYGSAQSLHSSNRTRANPTYESYSVGFRVASVPEPGTIVLLATGILGLLACAWRRRRR